jgi:dTDP-glucose 4,6-dehydratase
MLDEFRPASASHHELIQYVADRPGHDRRYAMDITRIRRELGWTPRHSLTEGLRETVEWYLAHPDWTTAIQKQMEYQDWMARNYEKRENPE